VVRPTPDAGFIIAAPHVLGLPESLKRNAYRAMQLQTGSQSMR